MREGTDMFSNNNRATIAPHRAIALCLVLLVGAFVSPASAQRQLWVSQFGTAGSDAGAALAADGAGGVMLAGYTDGVLNAPSYGIRDGFFARFSNTGFRRWLKQVGTLGLDETLAVASDGAGGAVFAGWTGGNLKGSNAGASDAFAISLNDLGQTNWLRQFGVAGSDRASAATAGAAQDIYIAGRTYGTLGGPSGGSYDGFVIRFDSAGQQVWNHQLATIERDEVWAAAPDGAGGVFVAGLTDGDLGSANIGGRDGFVARYSAAGEQLWVAQFGTADRDEVRAAASDGAGGVYVAGRTEGVLGATHVGGSDAFLARFDSAGTQLWVRQFGSSNDEFVWALAPDGSGGALIAGETWGDLGGPNAGLSDIFVARFDRQGEQRWLTQFGTDRVDKAMALVADGTGHVMVSGSTAGNLRGPNAGLEDVFLASFEIDSCYADCDKSTGNGVLDLFDFLCFQNNFVSAAPYACNCDTTTGPLVCDIFDFLCFQDAFIAGCP